MISAAPRRSGWVDLFVDIGTAVQGDTSCGGWATFAIQVDTNAMPASADFVF